MKKVLYIAYLYPPISNSGTQRSVKFTKHLSKFGWEPYVLTSSNPMGNNIDNKLLDEIANVKNIIRVPLTSELKVNKWTKKLPVTFAWFLEDKLVWRLREKKTFPDIYADWIEAATKEGIKRVKNENMDLIFSSGAPWSAFVVARNIANATGKPFILDYRDLWTEACAQFGGKIISKEERNLELKILQEANGIITVTESLRNIISGKMGLEDKNISVITNGYDEDEFNDINKETKTNKKIKIGYIGVWKKNYNPKTLLQKYFQLSPHIKDKIEIVTAGFPKENIQKISREFEKVTCHGYVSHSKAINLMEQVDYLFLTVPDNDYANICLPGKVFEYLASDTSIIAFIERESELWGFLEEHGGAILIDRKSESGLEEQLEKIVQSNHIQIKSKNDIAIQKFERKNLTKKLAAKMNAVVNNSQK